jgi:hypothetical protein
MQSFSFFAAAIARSVNGCASHVSFHAPHSVMLQTLHGKV